MQIKSTLSRLTLIGFVCVCAIGLIVMFGWFSENPLLVQIYPTFVPMQFNTALGFVLLGIAGGGLYFKARWSKSTVLTASALCFILSFLTFLQYILLVDFKIDELFMTHSITTKTYNPGRMAPNTAVCFVLASFCLLLIHRQIMKAAIQFQLLNMLSYFGLVLSLIAFSGYVMNIETTYGWGHYTRMALHTSVSFVVFYSAFILYIASLGRNKKRNVNRYIKITVTLCTVFSIIVWQYLSQKERDEIQLRVDLISNNVSSSIALELKNLSVSFSQLSARWQQHNQTPEDLWQADVKHYIKDKPAYEYILWVDSEYKIQWQSVNPSYRGEAIPSLVTQISLNNVFADLKPSKICQTIIVDKQINQASSFVQVCPLWLKNGAFDGYLLGSLAVNPLMESILTHYNFSLVSTSLLLDDKLFYRDVDAAEQPALKVQAIQTIAISSKTRLTVKVQANNELFETVSSALDEAVLFFCLVFSILLIFTLQYWFISQFNLRKLNRSKAALSHALLMQKAIVDNLGEALIIIDEKGVVNRFTAAAESIFGHNVDEVVGKNVTFLMPERFKSTHNEKLRVSDMQQPALHYGQAAQLFAKHKKGHEFPIELVITKINEGQNTYFIGLIKDISEQVKAQTQLTQAMQKAEMANKAKSHFLSNMSHEIRTPLNSIFGTLQILEKNAAQSKDKSLIQKSLYSARSLLTIINDILDVSKIEANQLQIEKCNFSVEQLVDSIKSELLAVAQAKGVELNIELSMQGHDFWNGDPVRIRQIMLNFASNAVKFTEKGRVTILVAAIFTQDKQVNASPQLYCEITDTGIGMTEEYCERLFNRFQQADESITRRFGGTGLGMAIAKNLIDLMNGQIEVKSVINEGSTFKIWLPLPLGQQEKSAELPNVDELDLSGVTVLLAEDNEINQIVFQTMLEKTKAVIHVAGNGQEAVDMLKELKPDLIFMDIQMPIMGGIEATEIIKQLYPAIPVVALTANAMAEHQQLYIEKGFDEFVAKPIEMTTLNRVIHKMIMS